MIKVSAPGKAMIVGEWVVLENSKCVVAAINKRVSVEIEENDEIIINAKDFGIENAKAEFNGELNIIDEQKEKLIFVKGAIEVTLKYLNDWKPFKISTSGEETYLEVDGEKRKIGFGSSAAVVVSTVAGLLKYHNFGIKSKKEKDIIYKLSTLAHYFAQGKIGSAFDIAASTYGNLVLYRKYDSEWLNKQLQEKTVKEIVDQKWPSFFTEELHIPEDMILLIGWTKESASTSQMVKKMISFKEKNKEKYNEIYENISNLVEEFLDALKDDDQEKILNLIMKNESFLSELTDMSKVNIETKSLKTLSEIANKYGGAGKLSGAGGGDIGIAICFDKEKAEKIKEAWGKADLYSIDVKIDKGVN